MQRCKTSTAIASKPAYSTSGTPGYFTASSPATAVQATVPGPDWFNMVQEELANVILAAGLELSAEADTQLRDAIEALIAAYLDAHDADDESHADIRALIAGMSGARYESIYVGAGAMLASRTNGATLGVDETSTNKLTEEYMSFGNTADTSAEFSCKLPENWDRGTIMVRLHWKPAGGTAGQVVGVLVAAGVTGDGDTLDRALGEAVTVSDAALAGLATVEHVTAASSALTVGGTMAAGKRLHFKITRDYDYAVGGSALAAAALLLGIEIQYSTSGSVAAWS